MIKSILEKAMEKIPLNKEEAVALLQIENNSLEFYELLATANALSRTQYNNKAYIFAQIGMDAAPCSGNCKFCSLAKDSFAVEMPFEKDLPQVVAEAQHICKENIEALFLMTTADYNKEQFLEVGRAVRKVIPNTVHLVANIGDFDLSYAHQLKETGFNGAYHIVRLREGMDTDISMETRIYTLDAIYKENLDLYYCIEPIGTEHTYDEIADEMLRARQFDVSVMAVMGRVGVKGTFFEKVPPITDWELTKIAAVTRIVVNPQKSMNVHEPKAMALLAGVNQLYAEFGANPRDKKTDTQASRGFSIERVKDMLRNAEYIVP